MTVIAVPTVSYRSFRGYADEGLPAGVWEVNGQVTGDASAGQVNITPVFLRISLGPSNLLYSLEQISLFDDKASGSTYALEIDGFDAESAAFVSAQVYSLQTTVLSTDTTGGVGNAMTPERARPMRGLFLGNPVSRSLSALIRLSGPNVEDDVTQLHMGGYWWHQRSWNAPGGPRRPPGGLYQN